MRYKSFTIHKYRGISDDVVLDVSSGGVYPIIGTNECGKTTILCAISAFDFRNDKNEASCVDNYTNRQTRYKVATISAIVEVERANLKEIVKDCIESTSYAEDKISIKITRTLNGTRKYNVVFAKDEESIVASEGLQQQIAERIIKLLPTMLFFNDFVELGSTSFVIKYTKNKDSGEEELVAEKDESDKARLNVLFDKSYTRFDAEAKRSLVDLFKIDDESEYKIERDNIQSELNVFLNGLINDSWNEWQNIAGDQKPEVSIAISDFTKRGDVKAITFEFKVIEKKDDCTSTSFKLTERSKGFLWFFNYIYKSHLNPNLVNANSGVLYLFDEPGCYLHAQVQKALLNKFKELGKDHVVIYNTHVEYLIDSELLDKTLTAYKTNGHVSLCKWYKVPSECQEKGSIDTLKRALGLSGVDDLLDKTRSKMLVVEGMTDWFAYRAVNKRKDVGVYPADGAPNIIQSLQRLFGQNKIAIALIDGDCEYGKGLLEAHKGTDFRHQLVTYNTNGSNLESLLDREEIKKVFSGEYTKQNFCEHIHQHINEEEMPKTYKSLQSKFDELCSKLDVLANRSPDQ